MPLPYRYELTAPGDLPITLKDAKVHLKVDSAVDNSLIQGLIDAAVQAGERFTGRDFRARTWKLVFDCLEARILLRKSQVASITSVSYTLATLVTPIASTVYQFVKGYQFSEVVLRFDQQWPADGDEIDMGNEIIFATAVPRNILHYKNAALRHLTFMYQNRGDCDSEDALAKSGAAEMYGQGYIPRV